MHNDKQWITAIAALVVFGLDLPARAQDKTTQDSPAINIPLQAARLLAGVIRLRQIEDAVPRARRGRTAQQVPDETAFVPPRIFDNL